jgi:hypothetical protein
MMAKRYIINLISEEKKQLLILTQQGTTSARKIKRAQILLLADKHKKDQKIADILSTSVPTVERTRKRYVIGGLEYALNEQPRSGRIRVANDKVEAILTTLAQSLPPLGRKHWTLQMLADRLVELKVVDSISDETVRRVLKKTN